MKRVVVLIIFSFLCFSIGSAQQNLQVKGIVIDMKNGNAVPFAHVGICDKAIGTVSNVDGAFILKIAPYYLNDTLCVSAIGFHTYKIVISKIQKDDDKIIELIPQTSVLQEVIISDKKITGKRVVQKAIDRIYKNYPSKKFILDGYYKDYLKRNNEYISLLEGAFSVQDMGFRTLDTKTRLKIHQMRYSESYVKNYEKYLFKAADDTLKEVIEGVSPMFYANEFFNMRYHNPIRNKNDIVPFVGIFNDFSESNYEFDIAYYTYVDGEEVYVVTFKPKSEYNYQHINVFGEIYIRVKDHAIMKFNYNYYVIKLGDERKMYELNLEYREYEGKMFLKYISYVNFFKIYLGYEIGEISQFREFFVTDIKYNTKENISKEESISKSSPLHTIEAPNNIDFWNNYNIILLETPYKD